MPPLCCRVVYAVVLLLWSVSLVAAEQVCFRLEPFDDVLQVDATAQDAGPLTWLLAVRWIGQDIYQLGGSGFAGLNAQNIIAFDVPLSHHTSFFGDNHHCLLHADLNRKTVSGPWRMACLGAHAEGFEAVLNTPFLIPAPNTPQEVIDSLQLVFDPSCQSLSDPPPASPRPHVELRNRGRRISSLAGEFQQD